MRANNEASPVPKKNNEASPNNINAATAIWLNWHAIVVDTLQTLHVKSIISSYLDLQQTHR